MGLLRQLCVIRLILLRAHPTIASAVVVLIDDSVLCLRRQMLCEQ